MSNMTKIVTEGGAFMTPDRALIEAVFYESASISMIESLLDSGASPDARFGTMQHSCLHGLAATNDINKGTVFLKRGADPNIKDASGKSPLHLACQKGFLAYVALLVEYGADVNQQDYKGDTPLHTAKKFDCEELVKFLLEKGADGEIKNCEGIPAKDMPRDERMVTLMQTLRVLGRVV
eukprot:TRINITY_DN16522_c0_g1_i1.p1 TRINITY_DN16522_c0_g1~~TRINITY_DN16522_c0_g1_i1.p1  ORF type:complete len:186 (+),score=31.10 TRINITY_DN16522_c0_g1_i1:22-558(+)